MATTTFSVAKVKVNHPQITPGSRTSGFFAPWEFGMTTNSTDTSYQTSIGDKSTLPVPLVGTRLVIPVPSGVRMILKPFGRDTNDDELAWQVRGWREIGDTGEFSDIELVTFSGILNSGIKGSGTVIPTSADYYCDSLVKDAGISEVQINDSSVSGSIIEVDHLQCPIVTIEFDINGSSTGGPDGAEANCLVTFL